MGYKNDQRLPSEIHEEDLKAARQESQFADDPPPPYTGRAPPPALPPRATGQSSQSVRPSQDPGTTNLAVSGAYPASISEALSIRPASARSDYSGRETLTLAGSDPRATSQESLIPTASQSEGKRILLIIYIHGFMGNETSFASFPAHVHTLLSERVKSTHAVYSKVYPRYKTRNNIATVRDQFSQWLAPHEGPNTDVILVGHSMGGIVAAEVALMPSWRHAGTQEHRLIGTFNVDVPFLGMHPGIIGAGLNSLFGGAPAEPQSRQNNEALQNSTATEQDMAALPMPPTNQGSTASGSASITSHSTSSKLSLPDNDPNYNPKYSNDLPVPLRKPTENLFHFIDKHLANAERKSDVLRAGAKLVTSHFEFGGTMAQYSELDQRYKQLRALEKPPANVRFVNYFSTCRGRPKAPKKPKNSAEDKDNEEDKEGEKEETDENGRPTTAQDEAGDEAAEEDIPNMNTLTLTATDPIPEPDEETEVRPSEDVKRDDQQSSDDDAFEDANETADAASEATKAGLIQEKLAMLPAVPPEPTAPAEFDPSTYSDKDAQKLAKQQHTRENKAYNQAVKDRNAALKEREKLILKYQKESTKGESKKAKEDEKAARKAAKEKEAAQKQQEKELRQAEKSLAKEKQKMEKQRVKDEAKQRQLERQNTEDQLHPEKKLKTFCLVPPKATSGERPDWVPVFVENVDQVTAHCALFNEERPHYEAFVEQVVDNVTEWVEGYEHD